MSMDTTSCSDTDDMKQEGLRMHVIYTDGEESEDNGPLINKHAKEQTNAFPRMQSIDTLYAPVESLKSEKSDEIIEFYTEQNAVLDGLKVIDNLNANEDYVPPQCEDDQDIRVQKAIRLSFMMTLFLITLKSFSAGWSGSIAVISTAVDSGLDVLSQGTMLITSKAMSKHDYLRYPFGKARMEPLGVVIFACVMGMAAIQLLVEAMRTLFDGLSNPPSIRIDAITVSIIGAVVIVQIMGYYYCKRISVQSNNNPSAKALADDHINDVCINILGGIPAIVAGYVPSVWWLDPLGAIVLSIYIAVRWTLTCKEQIASLVGKSASPQLINQVVYLAANHHPQVCKVDTVLAYHVGLRFQVECHIVLPANMPLRLTHDIGESLEKKIERLEWVEMAFVHADYEWSHKPEHKYRNRFHFTTPKNKAIALKDKPNNHNGSPGIGPDVAVNVNTIIPLNSAT